MASEPLSRSFLFLQGPIGPFFRTIGKALKARGHRITKVNFNGGDIWDWPRPDAVTYRGDEAGFAAWIKALARRQAVTDVVMIGDCRPLHRLACETLRAWRPGLRVHVFEEGYLRPDTITLELDGVNALSALPRDPDILLAAPEAALPIVHSEPVGPQTAIMGWRSTVAYFVMFLLGWMFTRYRHHRELGPLAEWWLWVKRLLSRRWRIARVAREEAALLATRRPFYLALMQLNADKQLVFHSGFSDVRAFMEATVASFAAHAPQDTLLVFKGHPLDNGEIDHARVLHALASAAGVGDRVVYLDGGNLIELLQACRGVITINSTAGISALHRQIPLVVLGRAIYDLPGLTHQGSLDSFWTDLQPPRRDLYMAWRQVVALRSQINGGFYSRRGIALSVAAVIDRLEHPRPSDHDIHGAAPAESPIEDKPRVAWR